jgi:NAD(P)-dependent dehydrogenase (short-subunit alcohol dehydrogenase family)
MAKLSGKIAVVTGGTGALGRVVVQHLLEEDAFVVIGHSGRGSEKSVQKEIEPVHPNVSSQMIDVMSETSVAQFYERFFGMHPRIDILCNLVGGVSEKTAVEDVPLAVWDRMMQVNLLSVFLMMRPALRSMKSTGFGRIINIAAMPAVTPEALRGGYGVSKAGVIALTRTAAEECKEYKDITINAIAPSIILTDANKEWGTPEEQKKWVTPGQIAGMITFLCSEPGAALNGQIIQMYGKV